METRHGSSLFIVFLLCSSALILRLMWTYVAAIVLALLISSVLYPAYRRINRLFQGRAQAAAVIMCLFIFVVLVVPVGWFLGTLSNEALDFYNRTRTAVSMKQIQEAFESDAAWAQQVRRLGRFAGLEFTPEKIRELESSIGKWVGLFLYRQLSSIASNLFGFLVNFFLMILTIYYLFRDGTRLKRYLIDLVPVPREQLEKVVEKFQRMSRAILFGNGLSGIIQGVLGGFGFYLFNMNAPLLWGTIVAFMAFLPILGASVVFVPATVILLLQGQTGAAFAFLAYSILYSAVVEYLVKPRLIGKGMEMNSLLVFIGIIGGIKLFGILGIIYGPLIITIFMTLAEIYRLHYRTQEA